jgi:hypothetical protein
MDTCQINARRTKPTRSLAISEMVHDVLRRATGIEPTIAVHKRNTQKRRDSQMMRLFQRMSQGV